MSLSGDSFLNQGMNGPEAEVLDVQVCARSQGRGLELMEGKVSGPLGQEEEKERERYDKTREGILGALQT